ncbi:MAG: hypothetical protein ACLGHX_10335 [Acidimicrobiia bacterium]
MYTFLLFLHVVGAAAWIGAALKEALEKPLAHVGEPSQRAAWLRAQNALASRLYIPAAVVVAVTGILMVVDNEAIGFGTPFVSVGFFMVVFGAAVGGGLLGKRAEQAAAFLDQGDVTAAAAVEAKARPFELLDIALLLVTVAAMVWKWGL